MMLWYTICNSSLLLIKVERKMYMSIFSIFNNNNKKDNNKQLTLEEKWNIDSESYNNPDYKAQTGQTQCYNCIYMNKSNIFKCPKVGDVSKEILKGEVKCDYREEKNK